MKSVRVTVDIIEDGMTSQWTEARPIEGVLGGVTQSALSAFFECMEKLRHAHIRSLDFKKKKIDEAFKILAEEIQLEEQTIETTALIKHAFNAGCIANATAEGATPIIPPTHDLGLQGIEKQEGKNQ